MTEYPIVIIDPEAYQVVYRVDRPIKAQSPEDALKIFANIYNWSTNWLLATKDTRNNVFVYRKGTVACI